MTFAEQVGNFILNRPDRLCELAIEYGVAESTVLRWARGVTAPLPRMQKVIEEYVRERDQ